MKNQDGFVLILIAAILVAGTLMLTIAIENRVVLQNAKAHIDQDYNQRHGG